MRQFYFRPHLVLSLITLIALAVLLKLGFWQKDRLAWKTDLLAAVEAAAQAEPLTSSAEVIRLLEAGEFVEFRRVDIKAETLPMSAPYLVFTARNRDISWRQFKLVRSGIDVFFAEIGLVPDKGKSEVPAVTAAPVRLIGYIRSAERQGTPRSESSPEANRWFGFNPRPQTHNWAALSGQDADTRFFIETASGVSRVEELPPQRPDIANNHFDYMLTWFSLAIVLCVFYLLIHIRDGRAGRR